MKTAVTLEFAELCGIICGDGHLSRYITKGRTDYKIFISGHRIDDGEYLDYIKNLFKNVTGLKLKSFFNRNYVNLYVNSKKWLTTFENIGIPVGKKSAVVSIPLVIKRDIQLSCAFLRGLADTDFSLVYKLRKTVSDYPRITTDLSSEALVQDVCNILESLNIKYCGPYERHRKTRLGYPYINYQLDINGYNNLTLWMKHIGFRNRKHLKKMEEKSPPN